MTDSIHARRLPLMPPLIGRESDLISIETAFRIHNARLVTLTGPGGVGKTRLALAAMESLRSEFGGAVLFISLTTITDADLVPGEIVRALGESLREQEPPIQSIVRLLGDEPVLLVLDNAEHVIEVAPFLADIIERVPQARILVTSRESLRVRAERLYVVAPLAVTAASNSNSDIEQSAAVRLFISRARAADTKFNPSDPELRAISSICSRLDGLPLAIELAAARVRLLPPSALLERLADPFRVLDRGPRDSPTRQRTMRDAIAWSFGLLSPAERELFVLLSAFSGTAPSSAVESIWPRWNTVQTDADVLDLIESLISKSLLNPWISASGAEPRVTMLETIREFGLEQLESCDRLRQARTLHADWFLTLAESSVPELTGGDRSTWLDRLERDLANLRAAHNWAIEQRDTNRALRFVEGMWRFWETRGHLDEGETLGLRSISLPSVDQAPDLLAKALYGAGIAPYRLGHLDTARTLVERSLVISRELGDPDSIARGLNGTGLIAFDQGDFVRAEAAHLEGLAIAETAGLPRRRSTAYVNLGILYFEQHRLDEARRMYELAAELNSGPGEQYDRAFALNGIGLVAHRAGDLDASIAAHTEAIAIRRADRDSGALAASLANLGAALIDSGDLRAALANFKEALAMRWERGESRGHVEALAGIARIAAAVRNTEFAARLYGAVRLAADRGTRLPRPIEEDLERTAHSLEIVLGDQRFGSLVQIGRDASHEEVIAEALSFSLPENEQELVVSGDSERGLTAREHEVLRLMAEGMSDRQIAESLGISRNTVIRHVSNIFTKLNVSSRTAAAKYAFTHGIVKRTS